MSKFLLTDSDFESVKAKIPGSDNTLEINKTGDDEYAILEHNGNTVSVREVFTKQEMKLIWQMLTTEK